MVCPIMLHHSIREPVRWSIDTAQRHPRPPLRESPWFYRLWTLQETILTPPLEVYFIVGDLLLPISKLAVATQYRSSILYSTLGPLLEAQIAFYSAVGMARLDRISRFNLFYRDVSTIFSTIFDDACVRQCSVQNDRIFAVQGALQVGYHSWSTYQRLRGSSKEPQPHKKMPKPDYRMSFQDGSIRIAVYIIGDEKARIP
ncbi:hypothetical protein BU23DRAFT_85057 [Bimuria novae-zelandiae CBS 107.79]|uniref:Heterokaryon incompatibility domain-containing protein n=1 Tax=Bimuria novae-zelandiae CBS 107.79 TaxID=1447943 RepID=A0A6A5VCT1_9PLEO|nr:hypothetical protein BU23DRAFT_85057 [Bimuria novae-zelandiae CBS 107.79]